MIGWKGGVILAVVVILLIAFYILEVRGIGKKMIKEDTQNIKIEGNLFYFDSLTLKQKIAQMIMVRGDSTKNLEMLNFNIGGVFLDNQKNESSFKELIEEYQDNSRIKLFVATDLEGAWNPFLGFREFPSFANINSSKEAFEIGKEHGEFLKEIGFNLNFAPVAEFEDKAYGGRAFTGTKGEIEEKLSEYIAGLQKNVFGTCKHYPGKGMIGNTHLWKDEQEIFSDDLDLFKNCVDENISAVMIGHQIVTGELDSNGRPASVSAEVIESLNFSGLVVSDEVNMKGLKSFYPGKLEMYKDLINSGENLILDFKLDSTSLYALVLDIEKEVEKGAIQKDKIDESVKKILRLKGYKIR